MGKGTIPYEMITRHDSLDISPDEGNFFLLHHFYSSLKDKKITEVEYEQVKNFYKTLKLKDLGELNKIYNFQDTVILCEIFEQHSSHLQKLFKFNPRKCNSVSSLSSCVHRDKSKCLIALLTEAEQVRIFEKTLIGGFSCVNTRLLMRKSSCLTKKNEKEIFDLEINGQRQIKRISTKIFKMDENNQYGQAMTKPLPYGCIKKHKHVPSLLEFNRILDRISHNEPIGHLFIVNIKFYNKNPKTLLFNEIYPPTFEKNKKIERYGRSTIQLMSVLRRNEEKDVIHSFKYSSKAHSTLENRRYIPLYAEHLHFLIKTAGWLVTQIYDHFTFEQSKFKKYFVVMNQKARQKATSPVECDFYKLLINSNFGIDYRNNIDNCVLEPLYDKIGEIWYIKKFCTIFGNDTYRDFFLL